MALHTGKQTTSAPGARVSGSGSKITAIQQISKSFVPTATIPSLTVRPAPSLAGHIAAPATRGTTPEDQRMRIEDLGKTPQH
jgi:hypothetical protein